MSCSVSGKRGAVEGDHIGLGQQGVQIHIFRDGQPLFVGTAAGGEDAHAQGFCDPTHGSADPAEADDAHGLARQLHDGHFPVTEIGAAFPVARVDGGVVELDVMAGFQQQTDGELGHHLGAVGGDVAHGNAVLLRGGGVHHIVARGQDAEQLHIGAALEDHTTHGSLVGQHDLGIADAADDFFGVDGTPGVYGQAAQRLQGCPAQIAGVQGFAVENDNVHINSS